MTGVWLWSLWSLRGRLFGWLILLVSSYTQHRLFHFLHSSYSTFLPVLSWPSPILLFFVVVVVDCLFFVCVCVCFRRSRWLIFLPPNSPIHLILFTNWIDCFPLLYISALLIVAQSWRFARPVENIQILITTLVDSSSSRRSAALLEC